MDRPRKEKNELVLFSWIIRGNVPLRFYTADKSLFRPAKSGNAAEFRCFRGEINAREGRGWGRVARCHGSFSRTSKRVKRVIMNFTGRSANL